MAFTKNEGRGRFRVPPGLEAESCPPEGGAEVLVASGSAQFGVSFQDSLAPAMIAENRLPVTAVAAVIQHNTSGIISRNSTKNAYDCPAGLFKSKDSLVICLAGQEA